MSPANLSGVLFDLDGTLIDTIDLIARSFDYAVSKVLGQKLSKERLIVNVGRPLVDQMVAFSPDHVPELMAAYNEHNLERHDSAIKPYPGIVDLLQALKGRGVPMGVVTSKKKDLAQRGIELCGLRGFIDILIAVEDTELHKPDPQPVLEAIRLLSLTTEDSFFVGDSPYDIIAGNKAGVRTVAVFWGPFSRELLLGEQPTFTIEKPAELLELLSLPS